MAGYKYGTKNDNLFRDAPPATTFFHQTHNAQTASTSNLENPYKPKQSGVVEMLETIYRKKYKSVDGFSEALETLQKKFSARYGYTLESDPIKSYLRDNGHDLSLALETVLGAFEGMV